MNLRSSYSRYFAVGVFASALMGILASPATYADEATERSTERAIWRIQEMYFAYFGITTHYSCDGLRDRVRVVLAELGAQDRSAVTIAGCTDLSGPSYNPGVRIIVAYPVAATDDNIKAATQDVKRAELVATLKRRSKSKLGFSLEPFDAERVNVTLLSKSQSPTSASGDCELLEQVRDHVIKPMGGTIVKDELRCMPHQGTASNSRLIVDVLTEKRS
jgi:hypothetical protein